MKPLYHVDPYQREARARVQEITPEGGLVLDQALFHPQGGGQPGDSGAVTWDGCRLPVATTMRSLDGRSAVLVPAEPVPLPPLGAHVVQHLDWERRHAHMRLHTALHLLGAVLARPVLGGQISGFGGWLDVAAPEGLPEAGAVEEALTELVDRDLEVRQDWLAEAPRAPRSGAIGSLTARPPRAPREIRMISIGQGDEQVDRQPCEGTHVARTSEIGALRLAAVEAMGGERLRLSLRLI